MSKLLLLRQSGLPVQPEAMKQYQQEWPLLFDKIQDRVKEIYTRENPKYLKMTPSHIMSKRMCDFIERQLFKRLAAEVYVDLPQNQQEWFELTKKYEFPIAVAERADKPGNMILFIVDVGFRD